MLFLIGDVCVFPRESGLALLGPQNSALMRIFTSTMRLNLTPVSCPSPNHLQGQIGESSALTPCTVLGLPLQPNASFSSRNLHGRGSSGTWMPFHPQSPMDPLGFLPSEGLLLNLGFYGQPHTPLAEECVLLGYGIATSQLPSKWAMGCNSGRSDPGCVPA